jgi:hypothetical protein
MRYQRFVLLSLWRPAMDLASAVCFTTQLDARLRRAGLS